METAGREAHVRVLAVSRKGEVTLAPLAGAVTVIAFTGIEKAVRANAAKSRVLMS
jgi:hypothetical protein